MGLNGLGMLVSESRPGSEPEGSSTPVISGAGIVRVWSTGKSENLRTTPEAGNVTTRESTTATVPTPNSSGSESCARWPEPPPQRPAKARRLSDKPRPACWSRTQVPHSDVVHHGDGRMEGDKRRKGPFHQPVDLDTRPGCPEVGYCRKGMHDVAKRRELDDQDPHGVSADKSSIWSRFTDRVQLE